MTHSLEYSPNSGHIFHLWRPKESILAWSRVQGDRFLNITRILSPLKALLSLSLWSSANKGIEISSMISSLSWFTYDKFYSSGREYCHLMSSLDKVRLPYIFDFYVDSFDPSISLDTYIVLDNVTQIRLHSCSIVSEWCSPFDISQTYECFR